MDYALAREDYYWEWMREHRYEREPEPEEPDPRIANGWTPLDLTDLEEIEYRLEWGEDGRDISDFTSEELCEIVEEKTGRDAFSAEWNTFQGGIRYRYWRW